MYLSKIRSILAILVMYIACIVGCIFLYPIIKIPGDAGQAILIKILLLDVNDKFTLCGQINDINFI